MAAALFKNSQQYEARSAGTAKNARIKVTSGLLGWADQIFVVEKHHRDRLQQRHIEAITNKQIVVLDIPDIYTFMDAALVETLQAQLSDYLD